MYNPILWSEEEEEKIIKLRREHLTIVEIAKIVNRSHRSVRLRLQRLLSIVERRKIEREFRARHRLYNWDTEDRKRYDGKWYEKNREEVLDRTKKFKKERSAEYEEYKKKQRCTDCGNEDFRVIVFHHLGNKSDNVSNLLNKTSWERILEELQKCIPLCANCHTIRHYEERANEKKANEEKANERKVLVEVETKRTCTWCGTTKAEEEFAWANKTKGKRHVRCKKCQLLASKEHYQKHKADYAIRGREWRKRHKILEE